MQTGWGLCSAVILLYPNPQFNRRRTNFRIFGPILLVRTLLAVLFVIRPCQYQAPSFEDTAKAALQMQDGFSGAGYEARTRYLHLGKVALYQMS